MWSYVLGVLLAGVLLLIAGLLLLRYWLRSQLKLAAKNDPIAAWSVMQKWPRWLWSKEDRRGVVSEYMLTMLDQHAPLSKLHVYVDAFRYAPDAFEEPCVQGRHRAAAAFWHCQRGELVAAVATSYTVSEHCGNKMLQTCHIEVMRHFSGVVSHEGQRLLAAYPLSKHADLAELLTEAVKESPFAVLCFVGQDPTCQPHFENLAKGVLAGMSLERRVDLLVMLRGKSFELTELTSETFELCFARNYPLAARLAKILGPEAIERVRAAAMAQFDAHHLAK